MTFGDIAAVGLTLISVGMTWLTIEFWAAHGLTYFKPLAVTCIVAGQGVLVALAIQHDLWRAAGATLTPMLLGLAILALKARAHLRTKRRWRSRVR